MSEVYTVLEKAFTFAISHHSQCLSLELIWGNHYPDRVKDSSLLSLHHLDLFSLESPRWKEAEHEQLLPT